MIGSGIKGAVPPGRAQLPGVLPPENICFQVRAGNFQNLQETSGIYFLIVLDVHGVPDLLGVLDLLCVLTLSVFDDGNMPAIRVSQNWPNEKKFSIFFASVLSHSLGLRDTPKKFSN